jgi:glutamyl-tRNA reductase
LEHLPAAERAIVEEFSRRLMNKFLHEPSVRLRAASAGEGGLGVVEAARYLFGVDRPLEPSRESLLINAEGGE